jgi:hypothetical protein
MRIMQKRAERARDSLRRDQRGAIFVEFLAAFLPLTIVFLGLAQSAGLYSAKLITAHAAVSGARAAAVVLPDDPKYYDSDPGVVSGQRLSAIEHAVGMVLKANGSIVEFNTEIEGSNGQPKQAFAKSAGFQLATVRVRATYKCTLSLASRIVCGSLSGTTTLEEAASMPVHMASYEYPE